MFIALSIFQKSFLCWLGTIVWLSFSFSLSGQSPGTTSRQIKESHYALERHLPGEDIRQVYQDPRGIFWVLTGDGLYNFDGNNVYKVSKEGAVVPERIVGADAEGRVWLAYGQGGGRYWGAVQMFTRAPIPDKLLWPGLEDKVVEVWAQGEGLLALTDRGTLLHFVKGKWKSVARGLPANARFVGLQPNEAVWLLTEAEAEGEIQGIVRVAMRSGRQQRLRIDRPFVCRLTGSEVLLLSDQSWGLLNAYGEIRWSGLDQLIPGFDPVNDRWNADVEVALYGEVRDELWISYQNTLYVAGIRDREKPVLVRENPLFARSSLFAGLAGSMLLAEQSHLSHLVSYTGHFQKIGWKDPYRFSAAALEPAVGVVETQEGQIYIGTRERIYRWNPKTDKRESLLDRDGIGAMVWDADGQCLWVAAGNELIRLDILTRRTSVYPLPAAGAEALFLLGEWLYLGGEKGLARFHTGDQQFSTFEAYNGYVELANARVYGFFRASGEEYWIWSDKGIYGMDPERGIVWQQHETEDTMVNAAMTSVRQVWKDRGEEYWMATAVGLLYWDKNRDTYHLFTETDGLPASDLRSVHAIGEELWLGSDRGLIAFDRRDKHSRYYTVVDGLSDDHFLAGANAKGLDGTLYLGTRNGLTAFRPEGLASSTGVLGGSSALSLMSAVVYSPEVGHRDALSRFYEQGQIALEPEDVAMEMHFALPVLPGTKRVRLSYQLKEEDGWIPFTGYTLRLAPGVRQDTVIKIKAETQADATEESILSIPIYFEPVDPLRPWLIALPLILLLASLLWYFNGFNLRWQGVPVAVAPVLPVEVAEPVEAAPPPAANLRFFTGMAHELRAPLSLILGPAQYLRENGKLGKQEQALLETIQQNADYLMHQVDELLLLGALDAGKLPGKAAFFDADNWFRERLFSFDMLAHKKRIHISTHFGWGRSGSLYHYKDWLTIIVNNLLSNAIKFTPNGGAIKFVMGINAQQVRIVCADNGRGIHPDDQPHVFERYYTSRRSDAPLEGGTGIGLALVKELIDLMQGSLVMQSTWGEGTEFVVDIPLMEVPEQELAGRPREKYALVPDISKTTPIISGQVLLLVDDNVYFQDYMRVLLGRDYDVRTAANGKEALTLLRGGLQPALIVTDLMMPEMDGYQLLDELKSDEGLQQLPVVVLSVRSDPAEEQRVLAAGASGFFSKPLDEKKLLHRLQQLLLANKSEEKQEEEVVIEENWENWLTRLTGYIEEGMADDNFNVDTLAARMFMSRTAFYKKMQQLTGLTPNQYIMELRLQKARRILENQPKIPMRKLVRMIGLKHEGYFTRHFTQRFGKSPTEFR